jgi:ABC-type nitrate/sulfonate/bicarbonate transport system permease component
VVEILRPISGIAWIPLALFIFGVGHGLPIFIMAYTAAFPLLLGTIAGAKNVDRRLVDAARVMGLDRAAIMRHVVIPAALPSLLVSLRLGVASGWTAVIAAELVGAPNGLGYAISWYREMLVTPKVIAFIAMVGVSGYLYDLALRRLNDRLTPWAADTGARL